MSVIDKFEYKEKVTTGEAIMATLSICQKYSTVLDNVIRIKQQNPEDEDSRFRRQSDNVKLLLALQHILKETQQEATDISNMIFAKIKKNEGS